MSKKTNLLSSLMLGVATVAVAGAVTGLPMSAGVVAQDFTTGSIEGKVEDVSGAAIAGATIRITSNRGTNRTVTSDAEGRFRIVRLPIGKYTVEVISADHEVLEKEELSIQTGSTISPVFTMRPLDMDGVEEIRVVGTRKGNWAFNSTTGGVNLNMDDLVNTVPVARDTTALALLAPGTTAGDATFGNLASFSGASVAENVIYVNGMNVTDFRDFTGGSIIPFDFIQASEIKTHGWSAEFGRATGGVQNFVTRSGSNEFHFGANMYWEPDFLRSEQKNVRTSLNQFEERDDLEYNIWASGPLIKDKLFFAGMYQWEEFETDAITTTTNTQDKRNSKFWGLKFDFEPFEGHRFEATLFSDKRRTVRENFNFDGGEAIIFEGEEYIIPREDLNDFTVDQLTGASQGANQVFDRGGVNEIYRYTGVLTDWMTISAMYGKNPTNLNDTTDPDTSGLIRVIDSRNGQGFFPVPGFAASTTFGTDRDKREAYRIDADFYFDAYGEHHLRVGWDREELSSLHSVQVSGGEYYRYYDCNDTDNITDADGNVIGQGCVFPDGHVFNGEEYVRYWQQNAGGEFRSNQTAWYIQDSWRVNDELTLLLGARNETFDNKNSDGDTFVKMDDQFAFRGGFNYQPKSLDNMRFFGSYGRTYLPVATNTNIRSAGEEEFLLTYFANPGGGFGADGRPNGADVFNDTPIWTRDFGSGGIPNPLTKADAELAPMHQDEFTLGFEYRFDNGWTAQVTGIYRDLGSIIEDVAINHALAAWGERNGKDQATVDGLLDPRNSLIYVLTNPGRDMTILTDAFGELEEAVLTKEDLGFPSAKRTYKAIEMVLDRPFDGEWGLNVAYTLSWAKGNTEGSVNSDLGQEDAGLTQDFDLPATLVGAYGPIANDRRHRFKVRGSYQITDYLLAGFNATIESPRKFGCFGNLPEDFTLDAAYGDNWEYHSRYGADYWFCDGEVTPRGSVLEGSWAKRLDLMLLLKPQLNDLIPGDLSMSINVFNVFNSQSVSEVEFQKEVDRTSRGQDIAQNYWYGQPVTRLQPRSVRLSVNYKF